MAIPPFLSVIAKMLGPYVGGSVVESANVGFSNNAQRLTAMLGRQAKEMAPKASQLPKQQPVPVTMAPGAPTSRGIGRPPVLPPPYELSPSNVPGATGRPGRALPRPGEQRKQGMPPIVSAAAGVAAPKLIKVLGNLAKALPPIAKVAAAAIGTFIGIAKMPFMIRSMAESQLKAQEHLSRYSGRIARTMAFMKLQDVHLGMRTARQTAGSIQFLGKQTRVLKDILQPYGAAADITRNLTLGLAARVSAETVKTLEQGGLTTRLLGKTFEMAGLDNPLDIMDKVRSAGGQDWHPFQVVLQEMKNPTPKNDGVGH